MMAYDQTVDHTGDDGVAAHHGQRARSDYEHRSPERCDTEVHHEAQSGFSQSTAKADLPINPEAIPWKRRIGGTFEWK